MNENEWVKTAMAPRIGGISLTFCYYYHFLKLRRNSKWERISKFVCFYMLTKNGFQTFLIWLQEKNLVDGPSDLPDFKI